MLTLIPSVIRSNKIINYLGDLDIENFANANCQLNYLHTQQNHLFIENTNLALINKKTAWLKQKTGHNRANSIFRSRSDFSTISRDDKFWRAYNSKSIL